MPMGLITSTTTWSHGGSFAIVQYHWHKATIEEGGTIQLIDSAREFDLIAMISWRNEKFCPWLQPLGFLNRAERFLSYGTILVPYH